MQTFLVSRNYAECAQVLDRQRLGKQRVECLQIYNALTIDGHGWANHPAVRMWRGHERALLQYQRVMIEEWLRRGYKNTMAIAEREVCVVPFWITPKLCASHRSNLLRKDPVHYGQFGWTEGPDLPYVWPV